MVFVRPTTLNAQLKPLARVLSQVAVVASFEVRKMIVGALQSDPTGLISVCSLVISFSPQGEQAWLNQRFLTGGYMLRKRFFHPVSQGQTKKFLVNGVLRELLETVAELTEKKQIIYLETEDEIRLRNGWMLPICFLVTWQERLLLSVLQIARERVLCWLIEREERRLQRKAQERINRFFQVCHDMRRMGLIFDQPSALTPYTLAQLISASEYTEEARRFESYRVRRQGKKHLVSAVEPSESGYQLLVSSA